MNNDSLVLEPSLSDIFKDPIIQMLMKKDGVSKTDLMPVLKAASKKILKSENLQAA